jgi:hypothetical protein
VNRRTVQSSCSEFRVCFIAPIFNINFIFKLQLLLKNRIKNG